VELAEAIILSVLAASTPLLIAATGELVTERSGVLNLGIEGMMIVGAACGFGGAWLSVRSSSARCAGSSPAS
jgi:general nucleoside transport system permease protein